MKASTHTTRRVWVAVTARPHASVREIGAELALAPSTVFQALARLRAAGYVEQAAGTTRTRVVRVPFVVVP